MQPKELIQAWFDQVWNQGNTDYIDQHLAHSCMLTGLSPGPITCRQEFHAFYTQMKGMFDDLHVVVTDIIENGPTAAGIVHATGIHRATGKAIAFDSHFFGRIENDLIVEAKNVTDFLSVLIQTGALTPEGLERGLTGGSLT